MCNISETKSSSMIHHPSKEEEEEQHHKGEEEEGEKLLLPSSEEAHSCTSRTTTTTTTTTKNKKKLLRVTTRKEKFQAIRSSGWWRWPVETAFPDKVFEGHLQNPLTEEMFDFDQVVRMMQQDQGSDPFAWIRENAVYYPTANTDRNNMFIFLPGLAQLEDETCLRSRRYAERLHTGIANLNNGSCLRRDPVLPNVNVIFHVLDWLEATIHRLDLSTSPVIRKCACLVVYALEHQRCLRFSADSHGSILLARALSLAKRIYTERNFPPTMRTTMMRAGCLPLPFVSSYTRSSSTTPRKKEEEEDPPLPPPWEEISRELIHVYCFGNGYLDWVRGPSYLMINMGRDYVTYVSGINPKRAKKLGRTDIDFLIFDPIFPMLTYETHNMMHTIELLRQTFVKNDLVIGDFPSLHTLLRQGTLKMITAEEALSPDFDWPKDMKHYFWTGIEKLKNHEE